MRDAVLIQDLSVPELRELVQGVVQIENSELRREVALLREELRTARSVLTLKAAIYYFDHKVTTATLIDYISFCGLPAFKKGRLWFIYLQDLLDWQIGFIGHPSTKHLGDKKFVPPRHKKRTRRALGTERIKADRQRITGSDSTRGSKSVDDKVASGFSTEKRQL